MTLRKSLGWSFSQEAIQKLVRFSGSIAVARLLTPDEVGVFAIAMSVYFILNALQDFGVGSYLIREAELTDEKIRTVFGVAILIQFSLGILILLIRNPVAQFYDSQGVADVLTVIALISFLSPFGQPASALLRRDMRFDVTHHIAAAGVLVGTGTTVALAVLGQGYMSMAWGLLTGKIVRIALTLSVRRDHLLLLPSLLHWREVLSFGGWISIASICGTAAIEVRKLFLGAFINPASVAVFERSEQIPLMTRQVLFLPIGRVLLPSFAKDIREGRSIGTKVEMLIGCTTVIVWPAFLSIGFMAIPTTLALFGENWREAGEILPYLLFSAGLLTLLPQPEQILTPMGYVRRLALIRSLQAFVFISLGGLGAYFGLYVFAGLQILAYSTLLALIFVAIRDSIGVSCKSLLTLYLRSGVVAAISSVPAGYCNFLFGEDVTIMQLIGVFVACGVLWLLSLCLFKHPLLRELFAITKHLTRRA